MRLSQARPMLNEDLNAVKDRVLTENTAQSVLKNLQNLRSNQAHFRTRWIWELLQNARDAKAVDVSVRYDEDKVVFRHDGDGFTSEEVTHLIYHGSTKIEDAGTIGQYGSGFLTTHLLSPEIAVSGGFEDRSRFRFRLERKLSSVSDLTKSMDRAWRDFQASLALSSDSGDSGTEFIYPLDSDVSDAVEAVESGIAMLKRCAPFAVVFNDKFASIKIESRSETTAFRARRSPLAEGRDLREVVVEEIANQKRIERRYVVAQGDNAQVAIPVEAKGDDTVCAPIREIPKLFLGFPLIGTEGFGFPAVINSLKFTPTEFRDGVYLWQSGDEANLQNQKIIEEACALLVKLIEFAAESGWRNIYQLANVPQTVHHNWLNADRLKAAADRLLVQKILGKAIALNEAGKRIPPNALKLPFTNTHDDTLTLWDLLAERDGGVENLPRRDEAAGWRDAVESWAGITNRPVSFYPETVDGVRLAKTVQNASFDPSAAPATHSASRIGLKEGVDAIGWLDRLNAFLKGNGLLDSVRNYRIVPSQTGGLHRLRDLRRDAKIDEELKDIADLAASEWSVRTRLRDTRIASLRDEIGAGEWDNDYVVRYLIEKVNIRAEKNPDAICHKASKRLFAWIAGRQDWNTLRTLSIFSAEYEAANRQTTRDILKLDNSPNQRDLPLTPVASWEKDLQPYSDLFPMRHTLADFYFDAVPDSETWDTLARMGFVRNGVIVKDEVHLARFRPDDLSDEDDHRTSERVPVTDVAFMTSADIGIMARARQSRHRARLFWRFVTEWLIAKDPDGLEVCQASCVCDEKQHGYYPAEWLIPVSENRWVPFSAEGSRGARKADAQSLANLLRGSGWTPASLDNNPATLKLLDAIGVTQFDLTRSFMATTDEEREEQDKAFIKILDSTGGDLKPVSEFAEDLKDDPGLIAHLAERRERRRVVHGNQQLGAHVEELVKLNLESAGFIVSRTGIGSDFAIEDDAASLTLARGGKTWLIEVKATRDSSVRMTHTQALTAVERRDGFLLCVVPIDGEQSDPELDDVRASMRFVANIGARLGEPMRRLGEFQGLAGKIAAYASDGVQLEVESGAARVRVASSVWENEGFPLDDLRGRLK